ARGTHSSEGLGEGLVSLLYIVDALYDSKDGDLIIIDEPELSLHPALQRRLANIIFEYAASRQIVIATHSPYLIDLRALESGMAIARAHLREDGVRVSQLSVETAGHLYGLLRDKNNPHLLGLNAREIFFVDDRVVLVEGQEDVVFYDVVLTELNLQLGGDFFGWGVGGAGNMAHLAAVLAELGYSKVVGILDADKAELVGELRRRFPDYRFFAQPANDVRTKTERPGRAAVEGLLNEKNEAIRREHLESIRTLFTDVNQYLADAPR